MARSAAGAGTSTHPPFGREAATRSTARLYSSTSASVWRQALWRQARRDDLAVVVSVTTEGVKRSSVGPIPRLRRVLPHEWGRVASPPASPGTSPQAGKSYLDCSIFLTIGLGSLGCQAP